MNAGASTLVARRNNNVIWDGGEGDDIITGSRNSRGDALYLGGNGDDTFYPSLNPQELSENKFVGQGDQDTFYLNLFGVDGASNADYSVWGDWGYGSEDDPYNRDM